jgi:hypothetical protein
MNWYKKAQLEDRLGQCYVLSGRYVMSHPEAVLIHGSVNGNNHAWVETSKSIPDETTGQEYQIEIVFDPVLEVEYPKEYYYKKLNALVAKQYSQEEVMKTMMQYNHWGPWDENNPPNERKDF